MTLLHRLASPPRLRAALLSLSIAATGVVSQAPAQFGGQTGFAEAFRPDFVKRDMAIFNEFLGLEEWQRPIIEVLLDDYMIAYEAGMNQMRDRMQAGSRDLADRGAAGLMPLIDGWMQEKAVLRTEFLENVKTQLSELQQSRWPRFERALRRDKSLHLGELSGESTNLIAIIAELRIDAATRRALEPVLEEYETTLDEALRARESMMEQEQERIRKAMIDMDHQAGAAAIDRIMGTRVQVRSTNDRGAAAIAAALPEGEAKVFLARWREMAYPKIYRPTVMDRVFPAARELEGVTADQIVAIDAIEAAYREQLGPLGDRMMQTLHAEEPLEGRRKAEAMRARQRGEAPPPRGPDPLAELFAERDRLGEEARRQLEAILGPDLYASLPIGAKGRTRPDVKAAPDGAGPDGRLDGSRQRDRGASGDSGPRRGPGNAHD